MATFLWLLVKSWPDCCGQVLPGYPGLQLACGSPGPKKPSSPIVTYTCSPTILPRAGCKDKAAGAVNRQLIPYHARRLMCNVSAYISADCLHVSLEDVTA